ncbi:hypothetical protein ANRL2_03562 [Anaerolineae bacterium]|nr:hypothetical protein ANRL2_03562 [Anaerolineae bacterium]
MAKGGEKRYRQQSPSPISSILPSLSHLNLPAKLREYKITKAWNECVGAGIAKRACPERLMGTTLYCNVTSSAWMTEISYQKANIIERLNAALGYRAVTEIVLRIGPVKTLFRTKTAPEWRQKELTAEDKAFIEGVTSEIKDEKLKSLIKRVIGKSR